MGPNQWIAAHDLDIFRTASADSVGQSTTPTPDEEAQWFYVAGGKSIGPIAEHEILALYSDQSIDGETLVWRAGLDEQWLSFSESALASRRARRSPPPLPTGAISNTSAWLLAFVPIAGLVVEAALKANGLSLDQSPWLVLLGYVLVNTLLGGLDARQIRNSGRNPDKIALGLWAWFTPLYLVQRARALKQKPIHFIAWLVCFVAAAILPNVDSPMTFVPGFFGPPRCADTSVLETTKQIVEEIPMLFHLGIKVTDIRNIAEVSKTSGRRVCRATFFTSLGTNVNGFYFVEPRGFQFLVCVELSPI